jgi:hypothetical protein
VPDSIVISKKRVREGEYGILMYENGIMKNVETTPGMEGGRIKENDGGSDFNYDIL